MRSRSVPNHMPQHHSKHLRNRPHIPIHLRNLHPPTPPSPIPTLTHTTRQTTPLSPRRQPGNITTQHLQHTRIDPIKLPATLSLSLNHSPTHPRQRRPALHRLTNQMPRMHTKNLSDVPHMPSRSPSLPRIAERPTPMLPQRHRQRLPLPIHRKPDLLDRVRKPTGPTNATSAAARSRP